MKRARLILESIARPGWFNMAADSHLADQILQGDLAPAIRFYQWSPPAVSLGYHQTPAAVDLNACRELGWEVVRRPTGGRALLHLHDLSYSVTMPYPVNQVQGLKPLYRKIASAISFGIHDLGLSEEDKNGDGVPIASSSRLVRGVCLQTRVRGELTIGGRKVAAAAQRLARNGILQHGSILVTGDAGAIASVAPIPPDQRPGLAQELRQRACSLELLKSGSVKVSDLIEVLCRRFAEMLELRFEATGWTSNEIAAISGLRSKFEVKTDARPKNGVAVVTA